MSGMSVSIREAASTDLEPIIEAYEWLFAPPGGRPDGWDEERARAAVLEAIESPRAAYLVAIASQDGSLAGICSAYLDLNSVRYGPRCWVEDLAVAPGMRSQGIGEDLLAQARAWAAGQGATHLELDTGEARVDAQRFYDRLGPDQRTFAYGWTLPADRG